MIESEAMRAFEETRKQEHERQEEIRLALLRLTKVLIEDTEKTKRRKQVQENITLIIELYRLIFYR